MKEELMKTCLINDRILLAVFRSLFLQLKVSGDQGKWLCFPPSGLVVKSAEQIKSQPRLGPKDVGEALQQLAATLYHLVSGGSEWNNPTVDAYVYVPIASKLWPVMQKMLTGEMRAYDEIEKIFSWSKKVVCTLNDFRLQLIRSINWLTNTAPTIISAVPKVIVGIFWFSWFLLEWFWIPKPYKGSDDPKNDDAIIGVLFCVLIALVAGMVSQAFNISANGKDGTLLLLSLGVFGGFGLFYPMSQYEKGIAGQLVCRNMWLNVVFFFFLAGLILPADYVREGELQRRQNENLVVTTYLTTQEFVTRLPQSKDDQLATDDWWRNPLTTTINPGLPIVGVKSATAYTVDDYKVSESQLDYLWAFENEAGYAAAFNEVGKDFENALGLEIMRIYQDQLTSEKESAPNFSRSSEMNDRALAEAMLPIDLGIMTMIDYLDDAPLSDDQRREILAAFAKTRRQISDQYASQIRKQQQREALLATADQNVSRISEIFNFYWPQFHLRLEPLEMPKDY